MSDKANRANNVRAATSLEQLQARTLSVAAIRQVDQVAIERFGMHSLVLMENAAGNCVRWLAERYSAASRAVLLCGRGNNGGDGLVMARHLRLWGWRCQVFVLGPEESLSPDALANWRILAAGQSPDNRLVAASAEGSAQESIAAALAKADIVIDAMLGSGARGRPRGPLDRWIELANAAPATRIAIDIPTGLDADSGEPAEVVFRAHHTLTFVARKPGFDRREAREVLGEVNVMPIGIPVELVEELLR